QRILPQRMLCAKLVIERIRVAREPRMAEAELREDPIRDRCRARQFCDGCQNRSKNGRAKSGRRWSPLSARQTTADQPLQRIARSGRRNPQARKRSIACLQCGEKKMLGADVLVLSHLCEL